MKNEYEAAYIKNKDKCEDWTNLEQVYHEVISKIEELEEQKIQGIIFRSKAKWAREGERNTKYFLSLEKRNYCNKTMFSIILPSGQICDEQRRILQEQHNFYHELYSKDNNISFKLINSTDKKISETQAQMLDADIQDSEYRDALKSLKNGKCPGGDGLSTEFYKLYWTEIKDLLLPMFKTVIETGKLGVSSRRGLMQLIPKKGKDSRYIKNMRPLTLLNTDYKILATVMASRVKQILPDVIGDQQTGFMQGRSIHTNLRRTIDILTWINDAEVQRCTSGTLSDTDYAIISLDFVKCFDMIEHEAVYGALKYFGVGTTFIKYVKIFFNDFSVCTQNAGYTSPYFAKTRGINQGCPISPFLFLVCGEVMAHQLLLNPKVKGVPLGESELNIISQFADDASLFVECTKECIQAATQTLSEIQQNMGLTVSFEKIENFSHR